MQRITTRFTQQRKERRMSPKWKLALALVLGVTIGSAAVHRLHAQAKPKVYQVSEVEILDAAAYKAFIQAVRETVQQQASGRILASANAKVIASVGDPPKQVGISEFDSLEQAEAYRNSQTFKDLAALRNKAIKIVRQYAVISEN
jgi:uncharacterized protein (DUF1330 family)